MVKFGCGCLGFPLDEKRYICVSPCDSEEGFDSLSVRDITPGKQDVYTVLPDDELMRFLGVINRRLERGVDYAELRGALKQLME